MTGVFRRSRPIIQSAVEAGQVRRMPLVAAPWHGKRIRRSSASTASTVRVSGALLMALWKRNLEPLDPAHCMGRRSMNSLRLSSDRTATRRTSGSPKWAIQMALQLAAREHPKLMIRDNYSGEWARRQLKVPRTHLARTTRA